MSGKVITIAQQKGGSGKTTLAVNLAVALQKAGKSVAVLDTDPQGSLGRWFMTRLEATQNQPRLEFGTASAWGTAYECEKLCKTNDIVLIDTPPKIDADLRPALRQSDLVVVPVSVSHLDLWATEGVLDLANREGKKALIVLNRSNPRTRLNAEISAQVAKFDADLAQSSLGSRVAFADALGQGLGVSELSKSRAKDEITDLSAEILSALA